MKMTNYLEHLPVPRAGTTFSRTTMC